MADVVVVGTGCCGAWVIKTLTERGIKVLAIDAGPIIEPRENLFRPNPGSNLEVRSDDVKARQFVQSSHPMFLDEFRDLYVDDVDNPFSTPKSDPYLWLRSRQVGGRSLLWGGVCPRQSKYELTSASRDGFDRDWPVSYAELDSYYADVERGLMVTSGDVDLPQMPRAVNVREADFTPSELQLKTRVEARWSDRNVVATPGISKTTPSATNALWPNSSSQGFSLSAAVKSGLLELAPSTVAERIELDKDGDRVAAISVVDTTTGERRTITAKSFVLCAGTIETCRLLMNSRTDAHPNGLGGNSDCLGRYLMDHPGLGLLGYVEGHKASAGASDYARGVCIPRFRNLETKDADYIRGYGIIGFAGRELDTYSVEKKERDSAPFGMWVLIDMLPRRQNRVTISSELVDRWGIPAPHIECTLSDNESEMMKSAEADLREMLAEAKFIVSEQETQLPGLNIHEVGTARMGDDPKTSVVDTNHRVWDIKNLFVADGSLFTSIGWQNPTLTMMALAGRCCDRLLDLASKNEI